MKHLISSSLISSSLVLSLCFLIRALKQIGTNFTEKLTPSIRHKTKQNKQISSKSVYSFSEVNKEEKEKNRKGKEFTYTRHIFLYVCVTHVFYCIALLCSSRAYDSQTILICETLQYSTIQSSCVHFVLFYF